MTPHAAVTRILQVVMAGGETNDDFSQILAHDAELQHWVRLTVHRLGFGRRIDKINEMVTLLGQNRVRDLIIGRHIERTFVPEPESVLAQLKARMEKEQRDRANKKPPANSEGATPLSAEEREALEVIPTMVDFERYLVHAKKAEQVAIAIRNSYPGQAFAAGVLFDHARFLLKTLDTKEIASKAIQKTDAYIEKIFESGLRSGIAGNEIIQKISIPRQKTVYATALLRNIGKCLLFAYDPLAFEKSFLASTGEENPKKKKDSSEAEQISFELDHAQAGALLMGRLPFLSEIERSVDFHHNPKLLRYSNPGLYAMACVLRVSGALERTYQAYRSQDVDIDRIPDGRITGSEEFAFLKLNAADWSEIKGNYALNLMKTGL